VSASQFQLVIRKGPQVGQVFHLDTQSLIVGRDPVSDITINDPEISRQHARLTRVAEGFLIEDLGSTNGTFVNGQRLSSEPVLLQPGQAVNMGSGVRLVYEMAGTPEADIDTLVDNDPPWHGTPDMAPPATAEPANPWSEPAPRYAASSPAYHDEPPAQARLGQAYAPPVPTNEADNKNRRNITIAIVALLLLCCCCSFLGFMYQWGGDWLLQYLGY
jgi:pSer/pThr/pTyr-binding forkhead associated (FHA) protein